MAVHLQMVVSNWMMNQIITWKIWGVSPFPSIKTWLFRVPGIYLYIHPASCTQQITWRSGPGLGSGTWQWRVPFGEAVWLLEEWVVDSCGWRTYWNLVYSNWSMTPMTKSFCGGWIFMNVDECMKLVGWRVSNGSIFSCTKCTCFAEVGFSFFIG